MLCAQGPGGHGSWVSSFSRRQRLILAQRWEDKSGLGPVHRDHHLVTRKWRESSKTNLDSRSAAFSWEPPPGGMPLNDPETSHGTHPSDTNYIKSPPLICHLLTLTSEFKRLCEFWGYKSCSTHDKDETLGSWDCSEVTVPGSDMAASTG